MKKNKKSLLWKISGSTLPGDSYLFGTMHVSDERVFVFENLVREKIMECDAFATEFNLEEANMNLTSEAMNLPEGSTLMTLLSPKKFFKINKVLEKNTGMNLLYFNNNIPMLVTNLMTEAILSKDRLVSLDESLWRFAKENEKITLGIETLEEQLNIMSKIPLKLQLKSLLDLSKNFKKHRKQVLGLTKMYARADVQEIFKKTKKSTGKLRKLMLYDRNEIMSDRINDMIKEQTIVCAVGAAHLGGKKGILRLMKQKGYKLKAVMKSELNLVKYQ